ATMCFLLFFFQAEDGIRVFHVTGVQTCALPISRAHEPEAVVLPEGLRMHSGELRGHGDREERRVLVHRRHPFALAMRSARGFSRSEERRVGKECRSRWAPEDEKKYSKRQRGRIE